MKQETVVKTITFFVFVLVVATPLFYVKQSVYPFVFDKALFFQSLVEVMFALWLALAAASPRFRPRRTPLTLALLVFVSALVLTASLGVDPWRSFFSTYERAFGVFGLMHMAALALVLSSLRRELPWRWIFAASIAASVLIGATAAAEIRLDDLLLDKPQDVRTGATFGNPTFLAGYLSWNIFLALYFLLSRLSAGRYSGRDDRNFFSRFFFSAPWLFFAFAFGAFVLLFVTQTRGNILGLGAGVFVLLVLFAVRPMGLTGSTGFIGRAISSRRTYAAIVAFMIVFGAAFWFTRTSGVWSGVPGLSRFKEVSFSFEGLQPRLIAMRAAWKGFLERPVFGWGPENFNIVFNKHYDPAALRLSYQETRFDKPHNFLLEDLVGGGILLALAHLAFFAAFVAAAARLRDKLFGQITIAAFTSYFVGNLFIFDTVSSTLLLFVLVGFVDGAYRNEAEDGGLRRDELRAPGGGARVSKGALAALLIPALVLAYKVNIQSMRASYYHFWGFVDIAHGRVDGSIANFRKVLDTWSPYRWNFVRDFAAVMAESYFYNPEIIPEDQVVYAIREMERVAEERPKDAYNHYALVDMYNQVSEINPDEFLEKAKREAEIALALSPRRQQVLFSLAKTKTLEGEYEAALELVRRGIELDDKVADAHFYYGLIAYQTGRHEEGYAALKRALELGRRWRNYYDPLTVANFFANSGHIEEALGLYQTAYNMRPVGPDALEVQAKLGVAHYFAGNRDEAVRHLTEVAQKFDFKKSPSLGQIRPILDELGVKY